MHRTDVSSLAGVLLAGGTGARMRPLTERTNKHLVPVYMRPMMEYALGTLLQLGLRDVCVVTGRHHMGGVVELLGSGRRYGEGVAFTYKVQEEAGGIAEALGLAAAFAQGRRVAVILGDNVFDDDSLAGAAADFARAEPPVALNFLAEIEDPGAYGVATVEGGRILRIEEKPAHPSSKYAVTGLYLYPPDVFDVVKTLRPSSRGELEITDVNNHYAQAGRLRWHPVARWFDAGEPDLWMRTQRFVEDHPERFGPARFRAPEP